MRQILVFIEFWAVFFAWWLVCLWDDIVDLFLSAFGSFDRWFHIAFLAVAAIAAIWLGPWFWLCAIFGAVLYGVLWVMWTVSRWDMINA
jgi:hypothetical protein